MREDLNYVDLILSYLEIEDQNQVKITRLGESDVMETKARPLEARTESDLTRDLIIKSAHKLKYFQIGNNDSPSTYILN